LELKIVNPLFSLAVHVGISVFLAKKGGALEMIISSFDIFLSLLIKAPPPDF